MKYRPPTIPQSATNIALEQCHCVTELFVFNRSRNRHNSQPSTSLQLDRASSRSHVILGFCALRAWTHTRTHSHTRTYTLSLFVETLPLGVRARRPQVAGIAAARAIRSPFIVGFPTSSTVVCASVNAHARASHITNATTTTRGNVTRRDAESVDLSALAVRVRCAHCALASLRKCRVRGARG